MPERTFFLKPRPPLRAFAIAAALSLVGALFLVLALQLEWHVVVAVLAALVLAVGITLFAVALVAMARLGVRITLTDEGYHVSGTNQEHSGAWADVTKVTQAVDSAHITIYHGNVRRTHLIFPGGPAQEQMPEVVEAITERLRRVK
ncbi:hypothetical protein [Tessaracoccus oleiagri]|uniref:PH domain-containing protein n=1 Tax=Tessaracoccus oleiagri TaxID=686624 RepID=A0A1G9HE45_9ACTN|nr:hypothetical protein [Tessaracoccus oleiagri]SDL10753.1 hypothetical protein SAMN04488242_0230 [Tessaracoccus oleiagri]